MLFRGKHHGYYLYELTKTDLIWEESDRLSYQTGNVLLFINKKDVALGLEQVKADDLTTALDYLEGTVEYVEEKHDTHNNEESLKQLLAKSEAKVLWLDGYLKDLTSDLESQRYSNQLLIAQLESLREQISIEQISRNEVIGDLELVSAETCRIDKELQEAIGAKAKLEQELAARICELIELDSANTDLQKRLNNRSYEEESVAGAAPPAGVASASAATSPEITVPPNTSCPLPTPQGSPAKNPGSAPPDLQNVTPLKGGVTAPTPDVQIFTSPTGKQIHVYHEFSTLKGRALRRRIPALNAVARVVLLLIAGVIILLVGSIAATAHFNNLSLGEALDTTLKTLAP